MYLTKEIRTKLSTMNGLTGPQFMERVWANGWDLLPVRDGFGNHLIGCYMLYDPAGRKISGVGVDEFDGRTKVSIDRCS